MKVVCARCAVPLPLPFHHHLPSAANKDLISRLLSCIVLTVDQCVPPMRGHMALGRASTSNTPLMQQQGP